jgi:hypothetical protein
MDLAMVKQEKGETLRQYMRCFFDKRATIVDVTDKEVIDLFQDGLYHHRTFEDFSRRCPSSVTKLKDMFTSWEDNTVVTIQRPAKDNSKKTSGGFKDLLKEKCPWHLEGNQTTEQCYQLRRALKDTPDPWPPHDKKGKKKADEGNDDF